MPRSVLVEVELDPTILKDIDELATLCGESRDKIVQKTLGQGILEVKLATALALFKEGKTSVEEASAIAQLNSNEFLICYRKMNLSSIKPDLPATYDSRILSSLP